MKNKIKSRILLSVLILLFSLCFTGCFKKTTEEFETNEEQTKTGMPVTAGMSLYDSEEEGLSFLYPQGETVSYSKKDGIALYAGQNERTPYLLIKREKTAKMTPAKYFEASDDQMLSSFESVKSTKIHEVHLDNKYLYVTRYVVKDSEDTRLVIERYIEIYDKFYIEYTAVSAAENALDTELYYVIRTLSTTEGAYTTGVPTSLSMHKDEANGISIALPDMLKVSELTIGFFGTSKSSMMLCVRCTADDSGNPIASRAAFLDKAASDPGFVAGYLGVDSVSFGSGDLVTLNGIEYYCYPMAMVSQGTSFGGKLYLADADGGCLVACYGVVQSDPDMEKITKVCESSIKTLEYKHP